MSSVAAAELQLASVVLRCCCNQHSSSCHVSSHSNLARPDFCFYHHLTTPSLPFLLLLPTPGVEHLLRNVKDATISTLASDVSAKLQALKGLKSRLADVQVRTVGGCVFCVLYKWDWVGRQLWMCFHTAMLCESGLGHSVAVYACQALN